MVALSTKEAMNMGVFTKTMRFLNKPSVKNPVSVLLPTVLILIIVAIFWLHINYDSNTNLSFHAQDREINEFYGKKCIADNIGLDNFHEVLERWSDSKIRHCKLTYRLFSTLFYFRKSDAEVVLTPTFSKTVLKWFNNSKDLVEQTKHQYILVIMNKFTKDGTLMNPLRNKRPGFGGDVGVDKYVDNLVQSSKENCDFCNYKKNTGQDQLGYLESKHSVTIANTFKIEKFHSLVMWRHHNPLEFNKEQFLDLMTLTQKWFSKSYELDKSFIFPSLLWDILPKASASQIHPHVHIFLSKDHNFSGWEKIFRAAIAYQKREGTNYLKDLIKIHTILKLNISYGDAVAFVSLTPSVSNEVIIVSKRAGNDIFVLFYKIMKAFMKMKLYAITAGAVFPPMDPSFKYSNKMDIPCIIRIVSRGAVDKARADISSMELFGSGNINVDLWDFRTQLLKSLEQ